MKRAIAMTVLAAVCVGGCTSYYKVTDPTTGKTYYTTELNRKKSSGAATLTDGRTGNTVNLQNSEIAKISKEEYETGRNTAPVEAEKPAANPYR